jgi:hypothetical protein
VARVLDAPRGVVRQLGERAAAVVRRPEQVVTASASTRIAALSASAISSGREAIPRTDTPAPAADVVHVGTAIGELARVGAPTGLAATLGGAAARLESSLVGTIARLNTLTPVASLLQPVLAATPTPPLPLPLPAGDFGSLGGASPSSPIGSSAAAKPGTSPPAEALAQSGPAMTETPIEASGASSHASRLVPSERGAATAGGGGPHARAPGEALATRARSIVATAAAPGTPRTAFADSRARGASPFGPAPAGGIGAGAVASGVAAGFGLSLPLALAALLLALTPCTLRRLRLAAARWRIAPLRLIPARPG